MGRYQHRAVAELCAELLYSPERVRRRHVWRLEALLAGLEPDRKYPLDYLCYRITGFHPQGRMTVLSGAEVRADLWQLLQDLSARLRDPVAADGEPILRLEEVARRCHVSIRTVHRWRREGLVSRQFLFPDGRTYAGVRESVLERFLEKYRRQVRRSRPFSRLTETERQRLVERARALCAAGNLSFSAIVRQLAAETGRARETVRYTLRAHAHELPGLRFSRLAASLSEKDREVICAEYRRGVSASELARRFGRSRSVIYGCIRQAARRHILQATISFLPSPEFERPNAFHDILGPQGLDVVDSLPDRDICPAQPGDAMPDLSQLPVLTREAEADLFRKYNYIKYRMAQIQAEVRAGRYSAARAELFSRLEQSAAQLRRTLIRCNLRLVLAIARRHLGPLTNLADLVSIGNMALLRAVEKFDYTRGNKFSTYAGWAIAKEYAHAVPEENYRMTTFVTGQEEILRATPESPDDSLERSDWLGHVRSRVQAAMSQLTERERQVIQSRFGIASQPQMTLDQLGRALGLTRERIRQIELSALTKLRQILGPHAAEMLPA